MSREKYKNTNKLKLNIKKFMLRGKLSQIKQQLGDLTSLKASSLFCTTQTNHLLACPEKKI